MLHTQLAALALATTALAAAGCGGSSKTGSTSATPMTPPATSGAAASAAAAKTTPGGSLTRAALVIQAGTICKRIYARRISPELLTQQGTKIPLFASYQRTALAELRKLTPPASMKSDWDRFAAATRKLASDTIKLGEYVKAGHVATISTPLAQTEQKDESRVAVLARRAGIVGCVEAY